MAFEVVWAAPDLLPLPQEPLPIGRIALVAGRHQVVLPSVLSFQRIRTKSGFCTQHEVPMVGGRLETTMASQLRVEDIWRGEWSVLHDQHDLDRRIHVPLNINVVCCEDLLSALRMTDISVPARTGGRTTAHTEEYTICHLLSTLARHNHLRFPLTVSSRDRPDVFIEAGGVGIGIEITESIPEQFASLCALAEKEFPDTWLPVDHFPWDAPPLTKKQTRSLLTTKAVAPSGWLSDEPEREWAALHAESD